MILVTGATGNVGRNVVEQLLAEGQEVRALTRDAARARFPDQVDVVSGDLSRPETLPAALDGVERAFLFPVPGQLEGFLDLARRSGVGRIVLLSSSAVTIEHPSPIARAHLDNEQAVALSGLPWTFVRPGAFMANDLRWAPQIKAEGVVRAPYGNATTAPIDERDIAAVVVTALLHDGQAGCSYTLTGPESLTQIERVQILATVLGRALRFEEQTPGQFRQQMSRLPPYVADSLLELLASRVGTTAEITGTVRQVTGRPPHSYRQWAAHHRADFSELS
jgi:uncharacterized protein YbjT (DUF2867 family)